MNIKHTLIRLFLLAALQPLSSLSALAIEVVVARAQSGIYHGAQRDTIVVGGNDPRLAAVAPTPGSTQTAARVDDPRTGAIRNAAEFASFAAALSAIGATQSTLVVSNAQTVSAALTIPATLNLRFEGVGQLNIADGVTATINGGIESGRRKIFNFTGDGTGVVNPGRALVADGWFPEWWGAVPDGATDNTTAVNKLITASQLVTSLGTTRQIGAKIKFGAGTYLFTGSIKAENALHLTLEGVGGIENSYADSSRTVLKYTGTGARFVDVRSTSSVIIKDVAIEYTSSHFTGSLVDFTYTGSRGSHYPRIENVSLGGAWGTARPPSSAAVLLNLDYTIFATISHNIFSFAKVGIQGNSAGGGQSNANTINNNNVFRVLTDAAIRNVGEKWTIDGNSFEGTPTSTIVGDATANRELNVVIDNTYTPSTYDTKNLTFTNNWIGDINYSPTLPLLSVNTMSGGTISNNYFASPQNGQRGTVIKIKADGNPGTPDPPSMAVISGNTFGSTNSGCGGGCGVGIDLSNKANALIIGNDFYYLTLSGATPVVNWGQLYSYRGNHSSSTMWNTDRTNQPEERIRVSDFLTPIASYTEQLFNVGNGASGYALKSKARVNGYTGQNAYGLFAEAVDEATPGGNTPYQANLFGVRGKATSIGGTSANAYGVYGEASGGAVNWAGYFAGNTHTTGNQTIAGTLSVGGGTAIVKTVVYTLPLTPAPVNAHTSTEQTFIVRGLTTADTVYINHPALTAGTGIVGVRVSAADTLKISFANFTTGTLTPASGAYRIVAIRN